MIHGKIEQLAIRDHMRKAIRMINNGEAERVQITEHYRKGEPTTKPWGLSVKVIDANGLETTWTTLSEEEYRGEEIGNEA